MASFDISLRTEQWLLSCCNLRQMLHRVALVRSRFGEVLCLRDGVMKARRYIEQNLALGPDELLVITRAFDQAWDELRARFASDDADAARLRLAGIIISLAKQEISDGGTLQEMAVGLMRRPLN